MVSSFDFAECYPPIGHAPYWTILFGFVTSTLLTYVTYSSGRGVFSLFKSFMSCRCCNCSNKKIDLTKTNNWTEYPKFINICSANPFKKNVEGKRIYGDYSLQYKIDDDPSKSIPYYDKDATDSYKSYCLMYVNQQTTPYYNGWVFAAAESEKSKFKYEMAQSNDFSSNETGMVLHQSAQIKQQPLLINDAYLDVDTDVRTETLNMLNLRRQKFTVFIKNEIELEPTFCDHNVSNSNFIESYTNMAQFDVENHWIDFKGFNIYKHNVLNHNTLDINGRYLLKKVDSNSSDSVSKTFEFEHQKIANLKCEVYVRENGTQRISIGNWNVFGHFPNLAVLEMSNINDEHSAIQYDFAGKTEIMIKITGKSKSDRCFARLIELLFVMMGGYQLVIDIMYFVDYTKYNRLAWQKYECYCYILTNSTNMKQMFVFVLCWMFSGSSYFDKNPCGNVMKILFWLIYLFLGIPIVVTHIVPFMLAYCWILMGVGCFVCIGFCCYMFQNMEGHGGTNIFVVLICLISAIMIYVSLILWPVACMSRLYDGDQYIYSLYSVFNDRHTADYINHFVDSYHHVTQFFLWIL